MMQSQYLLVWVVLAAVVTVNAFVTVPTTKQQQQQQQNSRAGVETTSLNGVFDKMSEFFDELDAFVDDATSRRLGAGAAFYGKRKSKFYGEKDTGRKSDPTVADPTGEF
jgi:hypothetical protein